MRPRLIIVEGPDNCGKSTLSRLLARELGGVYWRLTSGPGLSDHEAMALYQKNALDNAEVNIRECGKPVIIDRHWPSDRVYGTILRGQPSCDSRVMEERCEALEALYIYCYRLNAVEEHAKAKDPDHPYDDFVYQQVVHDYRSFFGDLQTRQPVLGYYLDNFIDKPEQTRAFIEGLRRL